LPAGTFASARLIVIATDDRDGGLVDMIGRMGFASVRAVRCLDAARGLCAAGDIDACVVFLPRSVPDESLPWTEQDDAPGSDRIPSLLLAEVVTPYIAACARKAGYSAVASLSVPPRVLYRCIRALLQLARQADAGGERAPSGSQTSRARRSLGAIATVTAGSGKQRLQ
jgi:hypothetical protein